MTALPIIFECLKPVSSELAMFVLRIALIDYNSETESLNKVAEEISYFYAKYIDML